MLYREAWYREANSKDKELSGYLRDLENLEFSVEEAQGRRIYDIPRVRVKLEEFDRFLLRNQISLDNLPWWPKMVMQYHRHPHFKKWLWRAYKRVYSTPFWKTLLVLETSWKSVFQDIRDLLSSMSGSLQSTYGPYSDESVIDEIREGYQKWKTLLDPLTPEDFQKTEGRTPTSRETETFNDRFPRPEDLKGDLK